LKKVIGKVEGENVVVGARIGVNVRENPTTVYSAYIASVGQRPTDIRKATFRGFMPAGWSIAKSGS
jgi:hypothetical protein